MLSRRRLLIWAAGLVVYTVLLVLVGSVLLAFLLVPPWGEEGVFGWLPAGLGELRNIRWWAYAFPVAAVISLTQRRRLAVLGEQLGRKLLGEWASIVTPDTILRWHRQLIAAKHDFSDR